MRQVFRQLSLEGKVAPIHTLEVRLILYLSFFLLLNWMLLMFYYIYTPLTILVCLIKGNNRRQFQ